MKFKAGDYVKINPVEYHHWVKKIHHRKIKVTHVDGDVLTLSCEPQWPNFKSHDDNFLPYRQPKTITEILNS